MNVGRNLKKFCTIMVVLLLLDSLVNGRTITVGRGIGYDYASIQPAIDAAQEGDTVVVAQGTYQEQIRFKGVDIILTSVDANDLDTRESTVIEAEPRGSVVSFNGDESAACVLRGLTIVAGFARERDFGYGGGIRGNGTKATIRNCYIAYNRAGLGGGGLHDCDGLIENCLIYHNIVEAEPGVAKGAGLYECDGRISNCVIADNRAGDDNPREPGEGGGLHSCNGEIVGCTLEDNHAIGNGGGLYGCNGTISVCTVQENIADESGGGLAFCMGTVENCTIVDNKSPYEHGGGAVDCNSFKNCLIAGNAARGYGGGLYKCKKVIGCTITGNSSEIYPGGGNSECDLVANCVISGNTAGASGGGLHDCIKVYNCTIVGNYASDQGGAICYGGDRGAVANSIIWDNRAQNGGQVLVTCNGPSSSFWNLSIEYSNIQGGLGAAIVAYGCKLQWESTNLDMDPLFVQPGRWTNGTEWIEGDYHLLGGSPCIDAGDPEVNYSGQTDIDGQERVFGQRIDIGADESVYVAPVLLHLEIMGPGEVAELTSTQYMATAYYDDDSAIDVTIEATWSVEPEGIGTVDANGLFTLGELDEPIELMIKAVYGEGKIVHDAHKMVLCVPLPEPTGVYHVDGVGGSDDNDGLSRDTAFKTIQRGINATKNGETVLVYMGVYREGIQFEGKAITVRSAEDAAVIENPDDFAVFFYYKEGPESVLENFVIRNSWIGIFIVDSSPTIKSLTIVGNEYGIVYYCGQPDVSNCILWDNVEKDLIGCPVTYSCIEDGDENQGNINTNPLFVDLNNGDFHLQSERGRYWPEHKVWVLDEVTSPCIDAGDPEDDYTREREPNGGRINMGAYGGTAYASMSEEQPFFADVNGDGVVDIDDLLVLIQWWLETARWYIIAPER